MNRIHVITQSKSDYNQEQFQKLVFLGWVISSAMFTSLFYLFTKSLSSLWWIFFGFLFLFIFSDLTKNRKLKAYVQTFLGVLYAIWGVIFLIFAIFTASTTDERIPVLILTFIFMYIAYQKLNTYTTFFKVILGR